MLLIGYYFHIYCSDLDIDIVDNGDGTFSIYYNVTDAGEYTLSVKFGGQTIPGGFYTFTVSNLRICLKKIYHKLIVVLIVTI